MPWKDKLELENRRAREARAEIRVHESLHAFFWGRDYNLREVVARLEETLNQQKRGESNGVIHKNV